MFKAALGLLIRIPCAQCGDSIPLQGSKHQRGSLECPYCKFNFDPNDNYKSLVEKMTFDKKSVAASSRIKISRKEGSLDIRAQRPWPKNGSIGIFLIIFAQLFIQNGSPSYFAPLPIARIVLTFIGLYLTLGAFLNRSRILITNTELSSQIYPFPLNWKNKVFFKREMIENLSVRQYKSTERNDEGRDEVRFNNCLNVNLKNGSTQELCELISIREAFYLEKLIEEQINLPDDTRFDQYY